MAQGQISYPKYAFALGWYEHGEPVWTDASGETVSLIGHIDHAALGSFWIDVAAERTQHENDANQYATEQTGYTWSLNSILSDEHELWQVLQQCRYDALEASAKEARVLRLASCLRPTTEAKS
jgi:hypothetical protein